MLRATEVVRLMEEEGEEIIGYGSRHPNVKTKSFPRKKKSEEHQSETESKVHAHLACYLLLP